MYHRCVSRSATVLDMCRRKRSCCTLDKYITQVDGTYRHIIIQAADEQLQSCGSLELAGSQT